MAEKAGNLNQLKQELEQRFHDFRLSYIAMGANMMLFRWITEFLTKQDEINYTKELGALFIEKYSTLNHAPSLYSKAKGLVHRLDDILDGKPFVHQFREPETDWPPQFRCWKDKYFTFLAARNLKRSTIVLHRRYALRLLLLLADTVPAIEKLTAKDLYDAFTNCKASRHVLNHMKTMLTFLFESGITKADFSVCVPKTKGAKPYPSVYTGKEIAQLLSSIDCTDSKGKRDYAVLMIASHLGLRWSDIANLEFSNIDHVGKSIKIRQVKTLNTLTLVLNDDVENSIIDYIQNGRPQSESNKIFLASIAPFEPLGAKAGYQIARTRFGLAGIQPKGRKLGTHALRASYATALIAKGLPYAVAQKALGHANPQSMKHYARIDISRLRECAIDVPKPSGAFAAALGDMENVR